MKISGNRKGGDAGVKENAPDVVRSGVPVRADVGGEYAAVDGDESAHPGVAVRPGAALVAVGIGE